MYQCGMVVIKNLILFIIIYTAYLFFTVFEIKVLEFKRNSMYMA